MIQLGNPHVTVPTARGPPPSTHPGLERPTRRSAAGGAPGHAARCLLPRTRLGPPGDAGVRLPLTDISGNLPDIASDALVLSHGQLALATDQGVFTARAGQGTATTWSRLGSGLPNAAVDDLTAGPDGFIYAATHGRGVWRIAF